MKRYDLATDEWVDIDVLAAVGPPEYQAHPSNPCDAWHPHLADYACCRPAGHLGGHVNCALPDEPWLDPEPVR